MQPTQEIKVFLQRYMSDFDINVEETDKIFLDICNYIYMRRMLSTTNSLIFIFETDNELDNPLYEKNIKQREKINKIICDIKSNINKIFKCETDIINYFINSKHNTIDLECEIYKSCSLEKIERF
jgi:hypothetical protein